MLVFKGSSTKRSRSAFILATSPVVRTRRTLGLAAPRRISNDSKTLACLWTVAFLNALDAMVSVKSPPSSRALTRFAELGHVARACPEEASEVTDRVQVKCVNCDEIGHRVRDCPTPRVDKFACRNCKLVAYSSYIQGWNFTANPLITFRQSGHQAAECTEPRSAEGVECRKCNESKSCTPNGFILQTLF